MLSIALLLACLLWLLPPLPAVALRKKTPVPQVPVATVRVAARHPFPFLAPILAPPPRLTS